MGVRAGTTGIGANHLALKVKFADQLPSIDWVRKLPDWISVRIGMVEGWDEPLLVLWNEEHQLHVDFVLGDANELNAIAAIANLGGAIFEKLHPGKFTKLIFRQAELAVAGKSLEGEDLALMDLYKSLTVPFGSLARRERLVGFPGCP